MAIMSPTIVALVFGFPVVFGGGITTKHLVDIPEEKRAEVIASTGFEDPALGLRYEYFSIFFIDFWTGGGRVVLYDDADDDRGCLPLTPGRVEQLVGETPDELGTPLLYKIPLGWPLVLLVAGFFGWNWYRDFRELS